MNDEETTFYRHVIEKAEKRRKAGRARLTVRVLLLVLATTALLSVGLAVIAIARNGVPIAQYQVPNDDELAQLKAHYAFIAMAANTIKVVLTFSTPLLAAGSVLTIRRLVLWLKPFFHV